MPHRQRYSCVIRRLGLVLFLWMVAHSCSFQSPQEPIFVTEWFIPLVDKTWSLSELTEEMKELEVDGKTDRMIFTYRNDLSLGFDDQLLRIELDPGNANPRTYSTNVETVDSLRVQTTGFLLQEPSVIDRGTIEFFLTNTSPMQSLVIRLVLLDLLEPDGVTHPSLDITVPAASPGQSKNSVPVAIDLRDYQFDPVLMGDKNYMRFSIRPRGSAPDYSGGLVLSSSRRSFILRSITGRFDRINALFKDVVIDNPVPEELKDIRFYDVELLIPLWATVCVPMNLLLHISAENPRNDPVAPLVIGNSYNPVPCQPEQVDTLKIPNIAAFFNSNPERLSISGLVQVGDPSAVYTIGSDDSLYVQTIFRAPLIVQLPVDTTLTEPDTVEIDEDLQDLLRDTVENLTMTSEIENHTPMAVSVSLLFSESRSDKSIYDHPADLVIGPILLAQAELTGDPALVAKPAKGVWNQSLSKEQMELFTRNDTVYMGTKIVYAGTASRMVQIRPSDYVRATASLKAALSSKNGEEE
ncbi:hypothetical protein JW992_14940 [candidate division KSB1 bacterium]|nr:hypothetical protein [candidate division KSB1 bacterium]